MMRVSYQDWEVVCNNMKRGGREDVDNGTIKCVRSSNFKIILVHSEEWFSNTCSVVFVRFFLITDMLAFYQYNYSLIAQ